MHLQFTKEEDVLKVILVMQWLEYSGSSALFICLFFSVNR